MPYLPIKLHLSTMLLSDMFFIDWISNGKYGQFVRMGVDSLGGLVGLVAAGAPNPENADRFRLGEPSPEPAEAPEARAGPSATVADADGLLLITGGVGTSRATGER